MEDESRILNRIETKRVGLNLRVLPETAAALNRYVSYLCELAAREGRNESQITLSLLIDEYASRLMEKEAFRRWAARQGEGRRKGKRAHGAAPPEAETAPETAAAEADLFREHDDEASADGGA